MAPAGKKIVPTPHEPCILPYRRPCLGRDLSVIPVSARTQTETDLVLWATGKGAEADLVLRFHDHMQPLRLGFGIVLICQEEGISDKHICSFVEKYLKMGCYYQGARDREAIFIRRIT